jgi:hypothetical protein
MSKILCYPPDVTNKRKIPTHNIYHPEKSLNSTAEAATFLFLLESSVAPAFPVTSTEPAVRAFKYLPTPLPVLVEPETPVPGLLYQDPTLS